MELRTSLFGRLLAGSLLGAVSISTAYASPAAPVAAASESASESASEAGLFAEAVTDSNGKKAANPYDQGAWRTFYELMRPAPSVGLGTRAWESWKEQYQVYLPDGSPPPAWGERQRVPQGCDAGVGAYLFRDEKVDDVLDATLQAVKADGTLPGTLKDQQGRLVRYEIRMNKTVFDYIVENRFYNGEVQAKAGKIDYPDGSIIVKAAWKELDSLENTDRFVTRDACICDQQTASGEPYACYTAPTALVGFHVMHKEPGAPQWIWSTFEHVANVTPDGDLPAIFNNPDCRGPHCVPNSQTPDNATGTGGIPNQLTLILPIAADTQAVNEAAHKELAGMPPELSVLTNYQLMSTQWPTSNTDLKQPATVFTVSPTFSANTTMESFAQSSSSCMGCHVMSRSLNPSKFVSGDFTFTLNNANPKPKGAICGEYDYANSMFCSDDLILFDPTDASIPYEVRKGHALISKTYELLPNNVGNKLHCQSCHLQGGGDPNAAWWVGMQAAYSSGTTLPERINGCFKRSMSGFPLCGTADDPNAGCDSNAPMQAIIAYMDWLTAKYEEEHGCVIGGASPACKDVPRGYPPLEGQIATTDGTVKVEVSETGKDGQPVVVVKTLTGSESAGMAVFQQKCAFCHNDLGQGRYESDSYFRPALWGPDSYHSNAGMAKASLAAQFLRWNMPYTSGGLLTNQEALDLSCFIDSQQRPGKLAHGADEPNVCGK